MWDEHTSALWDVSTCDDAGSTRSQRSVICPNPQAQSLESLRVSLWRLGSHSRHCWVMFSVGWFRCRRWFQGSGRPLWRCHCYYFHIQNACFHKSFVKPYNESSEDSVPKCLPGEYTCLLFDLIESEILWPCITSISDSFCGTWHAPQPLPDMAVGPLAKTASPCGSEWYEYLLILLCVQGGI